MEHQTKPRKTDRRTLYTRMVIQDAYKTLLHRKDPLHITVTEICTLAEINRSTFYLHYQDVQAVLDDLLDGLLDRMVQMTIATVPGETMADDLFRLSGETVYRQIMADPTLSFLLQKGMEYPPFVEKYAATFASFSLPFFQEHTALPKEDLLLVLSGLFYSYMMLDSYCLKSHSVAELEHCNALFTHYIFEPCQKKLLSGGLPERT